MKIYFTKKYNIYIVKDIDIIVLIDFNILPIFSEEEFDKRNIEIPQIGKIKMKYLD